MKQIIKIMAISLALSTYAYAEDSWGPGDSNYDSLYKDAKAGDISAYWNLAYGYSSAGTVPADKCSQFVNLLTEGAKKGHGASIWDLYLMYEGSSSVPKCAEKNTQNRLDILALGIKANEYNTTQQIIRYYTYGTELQGNAIAADPVKAYAIHKHLVDNLAAYKVDVSYFSEPETRALADKASKLSPEEISKGDILAGKDWKSLLQIITADIEAAKVMIQN